VHSVGGVIWVYETDRGPNNAGSSFHSRTAIWRNSGGMGRLYASQADEDAGRVLDEYTYPRTDPEPWVTSTLLPGGMGTHDFGMQTLGAGKTTVVFTLEIRRADARMVLDGTPFVTASGDGFAVEEQPTSPVAADQTATFKVSFDPNSAGTATGELSIPIKGLTPAYKVQLRGEAVSSAKLEVLNGGTLLPSGDALSAGQIAAGTTAATILTLRNGGGSPLQVKDISIASNADFELRNLPALPKSLAAQESVDFEVVFKPQNAGAKLSLIHISEPTRPY